MEGTALEQIPIKISWNRISKNQSFFDFLKIEEKFLSKFLGMEFLKFRISSIF